MAKTLYALLVGINDYAGNVNSLNGCINDVQAMRGLLEERAAAGGWTAQIALLTSGLHAAETKPTREAVIAAFRAHLRQAGPGDVALFYYSGHGSQERAPEAFWKFEPDRLNETLVCYDSRMPGKWDLADKELSQLIHEVATTDAAGAAKAQPPHIALIIDACHSGSISRDVGDATARLLRADARERTLADYISIERAVAATAMAGDWIDSPTARHVLMAACRPDQTAKERQVEGATRGLFTHHLITLLRQSTAPLTYHDIARSLNTIVPNTVDAQSPQLEAPDGRDLAGLFLNGGVAPAQAYLRVAFDNALGEWTIDAGEIHGIAGPTAENGDESTALLVYADDAPAGAKALGTARVLRVLPGRSVVELKLAARPDSKQRFKAVIDSVPFPPVRIFFEGAAGQIDTARATLAAKSPADALRLLVRESTDRQAADIIVSADTHGYRLRRAAAIAALDVVAPDAEVMLQRLAHIARWNTALALTNRTQLVASLDRAGRQPIEIALHRWDAAANAFEPQPLADADVHLTAEKHDGKIVWPRIGIKVTNNSAQRLHVTLFDMTDTYLISADLLRGSMLDPGASVWARTPSGSDRISLFVPAELLKQGCGAVRDVFKVLAATDAFDATLLEQGDLVNAVLAAPKSVHRGGSLSALERLFNRVRTRAAGDAPDTFADAADWCVSQVMVTTHAPVDAAPVPNSGGALVLNALIHVHPHLALRAQIGVAFAEDGARDAGNTLAPPLLRDPRAPVRPLALTGERSGQPGGSVVTLTIDAADIGTHASVTPDAPLRMTLQQPLAADERVLVTAFDSESGLHMPVGFGAPADNDTTEIAITRLPGNSDGARSIGGAIRMAFTKVFSDTFKTGVQPNQLRLMQFDAQQAMTPVSDRVAIAQAVAAAQRVWVYVHGFTGDNDSMPLSALHAMQPGDPVTAVLAYDYENLLTEIQVTAQDLRNQLAAVGLAPGHGKNVAVIAHSLGTMVTRWLVEQTPGTQGLVQRVVLVGGPNAGTPAAHAEDLLAFLIGAAVNGLLTLTFPWAFIPKLLGAAASGTVAAKQAIKTLDQIKPGAPFYTALNDPAVDPHVPYTLIAGDVTLIKSEAQMTAQKQLHKLALAYRLTTLAFGNKPNDMVISVDSIRAVPANRTPPPILPPAVPCDHIHYFAHEAGLAQLRDALTA